MSQSNPSADGERQDDNPYAPPRTEIRPGVESQDTDERPCGISRQPRREIALRIGGLFGFIIAIVIALGFCYGTLLRFRNSDGGRGIEAGTSQGSLALAGIVSLSIIAAVTSWGVFRLKNWGRWALTITTMLTAPALLCVGLLVTYTAKPGFKGTFNYNVFNVFCVMSLLSSSVLVLLMWSPKGRIVFSPGYKESIRQTPRLRDRCAGLILGLLTALAGLISYFAILLTVLTMWEILR
jgi:hypothetical protein